MKLSAIEAEIARIEKLYLPRAAAEFNLELTASPGEDYRQLKAYCDKMNAAPMPANSFCKTILHAVAVGEPASAADVAAKWATPPRPA